MNWDNPEVKETTFDRSLIGKLSRRIHLPPEVKKDVLEERFIVDKDQADVWAFTYNYNSGWTKVWLPSRYVVRSAVKIEVIKRTHPKMKVILFRVWKEGQEQWLGK